MATRKKAMKKSKKISASSKRKPMKKGASKGAARGAVRASAKSSSQSTSRKSGPINVGRKPFSKSEFVSEIAERSGVARREVSGILEIISDIIEAHLQKQGPEAFAWPGILKIQVVKKPATKAREGINPFTGEKMMFKAKPASRRVKIRPLKQLKQMAA